MIVVDTNVTSELMKPSPSPAVVAWVRRTGGAELFTTAITLAEIRYGVERLPSGHRKDLLRAAADDVFSAFAEQVLPFDNTAAEEYPQVVTSRDRAGAPIHGFDALIASICRVHHASLATRNAKDFESTGIEVVNPWLAAS